MTTPHRTLQMALDALDNLGSMSDHDVTPYAWHGAKAEAACVALREALAAPEPEPVMEFKGRRLTPEGTRECWGMLLCKPEQDPARGALLYAAPPAAPATAVPAEDFCYCNDEISLQMVSGGAASEGLYGRLTLKIDGKYVEYVRAESAAPPAAPADDHATPSGGQEAGPQEDRIEAAYWRFDARHKGYSQWKTAPMSERDAFKAEMRNALEAEKVRAEMRLVARGWRRPDAPAAPAVPLTQLWCPETGELCSKCAKTGTCEASMLQAHGIGASK